MNILNEFKEIKQHDEDLLKLHVDMFIFNLVTKINI